MAVFEEMFTKSKGEPIVYRGKTLMMLDDFPSEGYTRFRLVFESCNAEWRQGAYLCIDDGRFTVEGQDCADGVVLWQDTAPKRVEFEVTSGLTTIEVRNVWDTGNGVMESWHNGAAMMMEPLPNGRRYRCNDGYPDDDFDDIVFRIERLG